MCPTRRPTDTCLHFLATTCLAFHFLTKVFATSYRQVVRHWNCCLSNYKRCFEKKQVRQVFSEGRSRKVSQYWLRVQAIHHDNETCTPKGPQCFLSGERCRTVAWLTRCGYQFSIRSIIATSLYFVVSTSNNSA